MRIGTDRWAAARRPDPELPLVAGGHRSEQGEEAGEEEAEEEEAAIRLYRAEDTMTSHSECRYKKHTMMEIRFTSGPFTAGPTPSIIDPAHSPSGVT